jgi:DMSO/TMAO reductase YedYZ molybdopterin-dependent catalytic subunit
MALAVGEAVAAVTGGPSLVVAVGDVVVDLAPGWLVRRTIDLLGTTQKPALLIGIVVVTLLAGGALGRNVGGGRRTVRAAFVAFGLVGSGAAAWSGAPIRGLVSGLVAASVGIAVLEAGLRRVPVSGLPPNDPATDPPTAVSLEDPRVKATTRRGFITYAAGVSVAAGAVAVGSRALARRGTDGLRAQVLLPSTRRTADDRRATTTTTTEGPWPPMPGHSRWVTPNDDFYRIDTALLVPRVDPTSWSMSIEGLVATRLEFTLDDLLGMDLVDAAVTLNCVSNEVGGHLVGNAVWTGVPLADLLAEAGPTAGAQQVMAWSVDGFNAGFPMTAVLDGRTALVAVGMNGEPLPFRHGFPARLVVAGLYGYVSAVKWLDRIQLTTLDDDGYWIPRGWAKYGPIKIASRIDVPVRSAVPAGRQPIAGVAWAPVAGIAGVEVSIDRGPWMTCRILQEDAPGLSGDSWVQWFLTWDAEPGARVLRVRAHDTDGRVQSPGPKAIAPDGAEGYHVRRILVA